MKLIFIDEVCGVLNTNLFGLCAVVIDSTKYKNIHDEFINTLRQKGWPENAELKGNYLFSNDPKSSGKNPTEMVDLVKSVIDHLSSKNNSRCEVVFAYNYKKQSSDNYEALLKVIISKIQKSSKGAGKNIIALYLDSWTQLHNQHYKHKIDEISCNELLKRGYGLIESQTIMTTSQNSAVGICYADIVAYISRWVVENPKKSALSGQPSLFDLYDDSVKTDIMKMKIDMTHQLAELIKKFKIIQN